MLPVMILPSLITPSLRVISPAWTLFISSSFALLPRNDGIFDGILNEITSLRPSMTNFREFQIP